MINVVKINWKEIQRVMILSQSTQYNWFDYARKISNGLSNNVLTKKGCGDVIWFVEHLPEYATTSNEYLKFANNMNDEQIKFIDENREFLLTIR